MEKLTYVGTVKTNYLGKFKKIDDNTMLEDAVELRGKRGEISAMEAAIGYVNHGIEGKFLKLELNPMNIESTQEAEEETAYVSILESLAEEAEKKSKSSIVMRELAKLVNSMADTRSSRRYDED